MSKRDVNWEVRRVRLCMFKELKRPCKRLEFDFRGSVTLWMSLEVRSLQGCKPLKGSGILAWKGRFGPHGVASCRCWVSDPEVLCFVLCGNQQITI